jgi:hypothetical protein
MFAILTLLSIAFIWTRPSGVLDLLAKVTATGVVLTMGCCLGMCTGIG